MVLKSLLITDRKIISKYPYDTTPLAGINFLPFMNVSPGDYGGRANMVAKLKNKPYYIIVDKNLQTVDVCIDDSESKEGVLSKKKVEV